MHPPGGIVGGDRLEVDLTLQAQAHAVLTTPGATRFYRSDGRDAAQVVQIRVGSDARLEWLPLETIVHNGCIAENRVAFELDAGAEMIGWDVVALGLPAASETFSAGRFAQHVQWPGHWLERGPPSTLQLFSRKSLSPPAFCVRHTLSEPANAVLETTGSAVNGM